MTTPTGPRKYANSIHDESQFQQLVTQLMVSYTPIGVHTWLGSPNAHLNGQRPIDVWTSGDKQQVRAAVDLIEGGS